VLLSLTIVVFILPHTACMFHDVRAMIECYDKCDGVVLLGYLHNAATLHKNPG
jgi:hypothetical protein